EKAAGRRYATGADLADDLGRYLEGQPVQARAAGTLEKGVNWLRRKLSGLRTGEPVAPTPGAEDQATPDADLHAASQVGLPSPSVAVDAYTCYLSLDAPAEAELVVGRALTLTLRLTEDRRAVSAPVVVPVSALDLTVYVEAPGFFLEDDHARTLP